MPKKQHLCLSVYESGERKDASQRYCCDCGYMEECDHCGRTYREFHMPLGIPTLGKCIFGSGHWTPRDLDEYEIVPGVQLVGR